MTRHTHLTGVFRVAIASLLLVAGLAPASDYLALREEADRLLAREALLRDLPPPLPLPPPTSGSPEYLIRVIHLIPTDRVPALSADYATKVANITARARVMLEGLNDFYIDEQEQHGLTPGKPMNIEREADGQIRVIILEGTRPTTGASGYWGNTTGLDGNAVYFNSLTDIFGSYTAAVAASQKTSWIILPDTLTVESDGSGGQIYRGYMGLGGSAGTQGYGGFGFMASGVLDHFHIPTGPTPAERIAALEATLCDSTLVHTIGGYTGNMSGTPPACAASRNLMRGEFASIYLGVLGHEFLHGLRLGHDSLTPGGLMGSGYPRMGATIRTIHGMAACGSVPLLNPPNCIATAMGEAFANYIHHNPYFNVTADPDKIDPVMDIAWPPTGYYNEVQAAQEAAPYIFNIAGMPGSGTPMNLGIFYYPGGMVNYDFFAGGTRAEGPWHDYFFDKFVGRRRMTGVATDLAGNMREIDSDTFGMIYTTAEMGTSWGSVRWVRRPPGEDPRPRDGSKPLGTFHNPYSDIQTAMNAAIPNYGVIMIGEGIWPISTPLRSNRSLHVTGEGVGRTILDGGGTVSSIFIDDTGASKFEECNIANLVLRNAMAGIRKTNGNVSYNYSITNCVFNNITGTALDLPNNRGNVEVSQNTIAGCGNGIRMTNYQPFNPPDRFIFRNNIVAFCTGEGIRLDAIQNLYTNDYLGYNLSHGNGTNWVGSGDGSTSYASNRLTGEVTTAPQFIAYPPSIPADLRIQGTSPAYRTGHTRTEHQDASRRDMGAFINTAVQTISLASAAGALVNAPIVVTATLSAAPAGGTFTSSDVATTNASVSGFSGSGTSWSWTLTPAADGAFSCSVPTAAFTDGASNSNSFSNVLARTHDGTAPTIALSSAAPDPTNAAFTVTATLSEAPAAGSFTSSDVTTSNATISGFTGAGLNWSWTLNPSGQGAVSCSVDAAAFSDPATNGNTASNSVARTFDSVAPTITLSSAAPDPTNAAITVAAILSEAPASGTFTAGDVGASNAAVSGFSGSGTNWSWTLTPIAEGPFSCSVGAGSIADDATNANTSASNALMRVYDSTTPVSVLSAAADPTRVGTELSLPFTATDSSSVTTNLWVRTPGSGGFSDSGLSQPGSSGSFAYATTVGLNGLYEFATRATDAAGNVEAAPSAAEAAILLNTVPNGAFTQVAPSPTATLLFPMTDDLDMLVSLTGATPGGSVTVARTAPLGSAPAGLQAERLINEYLSISQSGLGAFTAEITWNFDPSSDDALTGVVNTVYRYNAGVQTGSFPATPSGAQIVVPGVGAFSEWYAGNNDTSVADWSLHEQP